MDPKGSVNFFKVTRRDSRLIVHGIKRHREGAIQDVALHLNPWRRRKLGRRGTLGLARLRQSPIVWTGLARALGIIYNGSILFLAAHSGESQYLNENTYVFAPPRMGEFSMLSCWNDHMPSNFVKQTTENTMQTYKHTETKTNNSTSTLQQAVS